MFSKPDRFHPFLVLIATFLFLTGLLSGVGSAQDTDVKLLTSAKYVIPEAALNAEIAGTVVVGIRVDETGKPTMAALMIGPMWPCGTEPVKPLEELASTLSATMMGLRFSPATEGGKPVSKDIAFTLQLKNPKLTEAPGPVDPATGQPRPTRISGGVLNGKASQLVKPAYPAAAKAKGDSGAVTIEVLVDEAGKVVRAGAVSGAPSLQYAARQAACSSSFQPTLLSGNPVKVSGVITYNFVP